MDKLKDLLHSVRDEYSKDKFDISTADDNPFNQFEKWFSLAVAANIPDVNAMNLATADKNGRPSSRIVLLRDANEDGFTFFTNYNSRKGSQLLENAFAALNFFWPQLEKQIRVEGKVSKVSDQVSDEYFASRPVDSQIGAWASDQSHTIQSREELEEKFKTLKQKYSDAVPRPPHWGGFLLQPDYFEFWQGRPSRLHDRVVYHPEGNTWHKSMIAP
ncbi:MAG TPA: pyridoxamine 5'-phosphate oxidase [Bacteroidia bacterium]|nr:MAG: pyridoxamine-phosphate oxidase [Bacteroidetes bacterium OLB10]MBV6454944.1 Pyridoxine/pyridoxamine 5'-phosphate oxidase [Bacteroidia bacterium]MCE7955725.1 pyridoxamine 5'-phosphate oxidase [Bacteroidetes bacterium CHB6]HNR47942.1 pyridoxamine 5'-phosphate oxidase [Bacteroidia bacterium]HNT81431.1 pyridoxamine 5'-phosphate oxidase [Bacteroidia bacterium]